MRPNLEEYAVYLAHRIEEQERVLMRMGDAINALDSRLIMVERLAAQLKKAAEGEEYNEKIQKWWN